MKYLIALLFVCGLAHAAPPTPEQRTLIAHMVKECRGVMGKEVCRVENNAVANCAAAYAQGLLVAGVGRFTGAEYCQFVEAGKRMCFVIIENCTADYDGRGCLMARALWRQR